jgi:hypothetical protein
MAHHLAGRYGMSYRLGRAITTPPLYTSERRKAIDAPAPGEGRIIRTALPDTFDGIRFEIGRMAKYVAEARRDPVVIDAARQAASRWAKIVQQLSEEEGRPIDVHNNKTIALEGIDIWCRQNFFYQNDPAGIEMLQTPRRMVRSTRVPREILEHFMEPFYSALEQENPNFDRRSIAAQPMFVGDCDEAATIICAMAAAIDITPVAFAFGGDGGTLHHTWAKVQADGEWYDCDITEPSFRLGDKSRFDAYEEYEVPL